MTISKANQNNVNFHFMFICLNVNSPKYYHTYNISGYTKPDNLRRITINIIRIISDY